MDGKPILVTGATGNTGSPLVELLTRRGAPVRVMVRRPASAVRFGAAPVQVAVADFDDADSLVAAVAGVGVLPPWQVGGLLEDYAHYARGEAAVVYPTIAEVTGQQPRDVGQFARDHASAFSRG